MKGFSTVEKLVFWGSIGAMLLVMVVVLRYDARQLRDAKRLSDASVMANLMEVGFHDSLSYPKTQGDKPMALGVDAASRLCLGRDLIMRWLSASENCDGKLLLPRVPRDPDYIGLQQSELCAQQQTQCEYTYKSLDDGKNYQIYMAFEGPVGSVQCNSYPCVKTLTKDGLK